MAEQETVNKGAEISEKTRKDKSNAGLKGQNALLRKNLAGLQAFLC